MRKRALIFLTVFVVFTAMMLGSFCTVSAAGFKDVGEKDWFYSAVSFALDEGHMNGVGAGMFEPNATVTRAMFATVLYRMSGNVRNYGFSYFRDNEQGQWYFDGVEYCFRNGIVEGYGNGYFGVNDTLTREDMMTMFYRYAKVMGYVRTSATDTLKTYSDHKKVSAYAKDAINWCLNNCVVEGVSYTQISPKTTATRAQLAQILMNFSECVLGMNVNSYRITKSNPYGFGIRSIRMYESGFSFYLTGVKNALPDGRLTVNYLLGNESVKLDEKKLEGSTAIYRYFGDATCLYESLEKYAGLILPAKIAITVSDGKTAVLKKNVAMGNIFQQSTTGMKLYFKGEHSMDSRILLYHDFAETVTNPQLFGTTTTPARLEEDINYLINNGYTFISMKALEEYHKGSRALPEKTVVITADDGYTSNYTLFYPILQKYNIPATIFVVVGSMEQPGKLTWEQMREMEQSGLVDIQSHSMAHENHTTYTSATLKANVTEAFTILEARLGKRQTPMFAYPYGAHNDSTVSAVKRCGAVIQVTTEWKALDLNNLNMDRLPRITVSHNSDIALLMNVQK